MHKVIGFEHCRVGTKGNNPTNGGGAGNHGDWKGIVARSIIDRTGIGKDVGGKDTDDGAAWGGLRDWEGANSKGLGRGSEVEGTMSLRKTRCSGHVCFGHTCFLISMKKGWK